MTTITDKLAEALRDAARSLETIGRLAGKPYYGRDEQGEPIPTYMGHNDEVRSYANNRAGVAIAALAAFDAQQSAPMSPKPVSGTSEPAQGEREAFEAWAGREYRHAYEVTLQDYEHGWRAWKARAALTQPALSDAEIDALRRDAERYRRLRVLSWNQNILAVVHLPKAKVQLGAYCPSGSQLDSVLDDLGAIDAALAARGGA